MIRLPRFHGDPPRYAVLYDPGTLAIAGMVASGLSAVGGAVGSVMQGRQQAGQANYQAAVARNNAILADRNAKLAIQAGDVKEQAKRRETAGLIGAQRAAYAAHGVDVNVGSPVDIQSDTAMLGELDALTIRNNAQREAYGYKIQGDSAGAEAGLFGQQAQGDMLAGWVGSVGSLIGGASSVGDKWLTYQSAGGAGGSPLMAGVGSQGLSWAP